VAGLRCLGIVQWRRRSLLAFGLLSGCAEAERSEGARFHERIDAMERKELKR
jgi:hypothetical protein